MRGDRRRNLCVTSPSDFVEVVGRCLLETNVVFFNCCGRGLGG